MEDRIELKNWEEIGWFCEDIKRRKDYERS